MDIEKKNLIRKIIGALVNAFFLPGLGQVICGRVKKGLELIAIVVVIPLGLGALVISAGLFQPREEFVLPVIILFCPGILGLFVVWVYALVDVIIGEVEPLGGKQNGQKTRDSGNKDNVGGSDRRSSDIFPYIAVDSQHSNDRRKRDFS